MVNVAVIGMGFMGCTHIRAYGAIPGVHVTAIADGRADRISGEPITTWADPDSPVPLDLDMDRVAATTDLHAPIGMDQVDVVDICLPTPLHADLAIAALAAGRHVICEKPLALDSAAAQRVVDAAGASSGMLFPAMCMRFWPQWSWLKQAVDEQRYGPVRGAAFSRLAKVPPGWFRDGSASGGAALDLHLHDTDFILHLFGPPRAVSSRGYSVVSGRTDFLSTQYIYDDAGSPGPASVTAEGGWCVPDGGPFVMRYRVDFERATADYDLSRDDPLVLIHAGEAKPVRCGNEDGYVCEMRYFMECVSKKRPPIVIDAEQALESIRVVEAEVRSARQGEPVVV